MNYKFLKPHLYIGIIFAAVSAFFNPQIVEAGDPNLVIRDDAYSVQYVSQSVPDPVTIPAGFTKEVTITFKNTGTATWNAGSTRNVVAYTVRDKYRTSEFADSSWIAPNKPGKISGVVAPGKTGTLSITLKAPEKPGEYVERFHLAADDYSWVDNGYFFLIINVEEAEAVVTPEPTQPETPTEPEVEETGTYKAHRFIQSKKDIEVVGGEQVVMVLGFQNTGTATWKTAKITVGDQSALAATGVSFADDSWQGRHVVFNTPVEVVPGKVLRKNVAFRAPSKKGNYTATFNLEVDGETVGTATVKVAVTDNAPLNYKEPTFDSDASEVVIPDTPRLEAEPRIRVGIDVDDLKILHFYSPEDDYRVLIGDKRREKGILPRLKIAEISYQSGFYIFKGGDMQFTSEDYIRLEPVNDKHAVHQLMNVSRKVSFVGPGEFNDYRGAMEYRVGTIDNKKYAVNDLLFEDYVKGIAEFNNKNEMEFIKANVTAARTYAYKSLGKYPFFDVLSNTYDQLYLGRQVETYMPRATQAVEATRGMMVGYKNEVVITPYFGNSNGTTRSWQSVWGGSHKPWLVPVKAEYDAGRKQYGHGVGMSQRDANLRAKEQGLTYDELLAHYYTDTELIYMYK